MNKMFEEFKKYICVILIIMMVGLNAYNISKNTTHANNNAKATILLASGVETLAYSLSHFARAYVDNKAFVGEQINKNKLKISANEYQISANTIDNVLNSDKIFLNSQRFLSIHQVVSQMHRKPSYEYLKSVTVYVIGKVIEFKPKLNSDVIVISFSNGKLKDEKTGSWCGTGVIVKYDGKNTYVLTNRHVAGGYQNKPVKICIKHNNKIIETQVFRLHDSQDLALLKIKGKIEGKQVIKGLAFPVITEKIFTVGHSMARPFMYGEGVFSGTIAMHDVYQLPCIGGQSGSGVFNKQGELLGLVYSVSGNLGGWDVQWDFTRANVVKGIYLKEFLEENL